MDRLTVVSMLHNRQDDRVENLLWSLANQTVVPNGVVIVDTSPEHSSTISQVCERYGVVYLTIPQEKFNKPKALNYGIKNCKAEYVMCCDIDMFFSNNFIDVLTQRLINFNRLVLAVCVYLSQSLMPYRQHSPYELKLMIDTSRIARKYSPGAVQAASREWFNKVHGYDEKFVGLGGMDDDLISRARLDGLEINWIEFEQAPSYHQWHPVSSMKGHSSHLFQQEKTIVRNLESWGEYE